VQTLVQLLPPAEIGTAQQESPVAITEELWSEIQDAAFTAVEALQPTQHNSKAKAVLVTAAVVGAVGVYCTCTPTGRKAAKSFLTAGRNRLAKWIAPNDGAYTIPKEVEEELAALINDQD
jgi:hypothetical protein